MMNVPAPEPIDPIAEILDRGTMPDANDILRRAVFAATARVLRRRVWFRRGVLAASLFICYVAGAASMYLGSSVQRSIASRGSDAPISTPPNPGFVRTDAPDDDSVTNDEGATPSPFVTLCAQGDLELFENHDIAAAAKIYLQALRAASQDELAISAEHDNWLLMSLKLSQAEERKHAEI